MLRFRVEQFVIFVFWAVVRTLIVDIIGWRAVVSVLDRRVWVENILHKIQLNVYAFTHILTFIVSNLASYYLNRYLTFQNQTKGAEVQIVTSFWLVSGFSLVISTLLLNWMTGSQLILNFVEKYQFINPNWPLMAKLLTIGVTMVTNYVGYVLLVF
jgi:putative flippase GtrA